MNTTHDSRVYVLGALHRQGFRRALIRKDALYLENKTLFQSRFHVHGNEALHDELHSVILNLRQEIVQVSCPSHLVNQVLDEALGRQITVKSITVVRKKARVLIAAEHDEILAFRKAIRELG